MGDKYWIHVHGGGQSPLGPYGAPVIAAMLEEGTIHQTQCSARWVTTSGHHFVRSFRLTKSLCPHVSARARITDPIGQPREPDLPPRWPWTAPIFSRGH